MGEATQDSPVLLDRILHGHWVGRVREMAEANALWRRAIQGEGQVLLISGEPGVGKTRFVRELASALHLGEDSVLMGECYAEGGPPYAPLAQMTRNIFEGFPQAVRDIPEETLRNLLAIYPTPSLQLINNTPDQNDDLHADRQQVIEGFITFCSTLSARGPLLLFIDDAHWADTDTLFLLRALARRGRKLPVMIVMTYREAELETAAVLKEVLLDLNHERLSLQLKLERFTRDETGDLLAAMFGEEITSDFLDGIFHQTEGNPFFMEEVCKALIEAGQISFRDGRWHRPSMAEMKIPQTVRAVIQARLQKLPRKTQDVLRMAAILGSDFDFETLQRACDMDEEALINSLESAVHARLIAEAQPVQATKFKFNFVHVLIPTTMRESIIHVRRRRLHLRAAQAIETVHPDDFEALAYQYNQAGEAERARQFYLRAGDRAQRPAPGEAARFYQTALELWPEDDELGKAEALAGLGYCLWTTDHVQEALRIYEAAYNLFQKLGDRTRSGEMQWMIGQIYWEQTNQEASLRHYHQALTILEVGPETPELARAISEISRMYMLVNEYDEAEAWGERALEMARRLGAEDVIAHAIINIGSSYSNRGNFEAGLTMLQSGLQKALASGLPPAACRAYDNWADALMNCCRYAQGIEVSEQLYAFATNVHAQNFVLKAIMRLAELEWFMGHWDSALAYRAQMFKSSIGIMSLYTSFALGRMDSDLGRPEEARRELEETLSNAVQSGQPDTRISHLGELARAYTALGQEAKTAQALQEIVTLITHDPRPFAPEVMPLCFASQWYAMQSTKDTWARLQPCLAHLERLNVHLQTGESQAALAEARGSCLAAERRPQEAMGYFQQAVTHWQSITRPYDQARTLASLGGVLNSMGDATAAMEAYNQAANIYDSLAAQLDADRQATFLNSSPVRDVRRAVEALARIPLQKETRQEASLLTEREIEVLKLVALGLTNAQIAGQLVLSPLTVNAHLRSIFNKLDVTNRTAAVHHATELGLV